MFDWLLSRPNPFIILFVGLPLTLGALALGYWIAARFGGEQDDKQESAFTLGHAAIFGLIALILGFSFSFAADRFEIRRDLVVREAIGIGDVYARSVYLPAAQEAPFRATLVAYTKVRLQTYADVGDAKAEGADLARGAVMQGQLWRTAIAAAKKDSHDMLTRDLVEMCDALTDVSEEQTAAFRNHVPVVILGLVLLSTLLGALILGITFGRAKSPQVLLSVVFCVLFAATVFAIVDLDQPQGGLTSVNVGPLEAQLREMAP